MAEQGYNATGRTGGPGTADVAAQRLTGFGGRGMQVAMGGARSSAAGLGARVMQGAGQALRPTAPYVPPPVGLPVPKLLGQVGQAGQAGQMAGVPGAILRARPDDGVGAYVNQFQGYAREGVQAMGQQAAGDFSREVGTYLGGLNGIGALRSGAASTGMNDIMQTYSRNFANQASQATLGAISMGQSEFDNDVERKARAEAEARKRHGGFLRGVGTALGAGVGFMVGGPAGMMAGAKLGGSVGGSAG